MKKEKYVCVNHSSLILNQVSNFDPSPLCTMPCCHILIFYFCEVALKLSGRLTDSCLKVVLSWGNRCLVIDPNPLALVNMAANSFVKSPSTKYFP